MSMTTSEVNAKLPDGMSVTPALIESLGITPVEIVKGRAKWAESDFREIVNRLMHKLDYIITNIDMKTPYEDDDL